VLYAVFVVAVRLWGAHAAFSDVWQTPEILVEVLSRRCSPPGRSASHGDLGRSTDGRGQQLSTLASLPPLGLAILITFRVIAPTCLRLW